MLAPIDARALGQMSACFMPLSVGDPLNNRYRIDARLAQGGMGPVYDGWDTRLGVRRAINENLQ